MRQLSPIQNAVYAIGALLILTGAVIWPAAPTVATGVYCLGAIMFASMQYLQRYEGKNVTLRRLRRQQILGATLLMVTGLMMIVNGMHIGVLYHNEWMVCLAIAAFMECYTAFRIPHELKHEDEA